MISEYAIGAAVITALAAALANAIAHHYATKRNWPYMARYAFGVATIIGAFTAPLFVALPRESAATLLLLLIVIALGSGLSTWLAYDGDKRPAFNRIDLDRLADQISAEHESE